MIKLANKIALASLSGAEEGMEKKALNLASLLRMSRNAAKEGKLRRFNNLLNKRNSAILKVAPRRLYDANKQSYFADIERSLIGPDNGPEWKSYRRLMNRTVAADGDYEDIKRVINNRNRVLDFITNPQASKDLFEGVAGPWNLSSLAHYSLKQNPLNKIDKLTYPGL